MLAGAVTGRAMRDGHPFQPERARNRPLSAAIPLIAAPKRSSRQERKGEVLGGYASDRV